MYARRLDIITTVVLPVLLPIVSLIVVGLVTARLSLREKVPVNLHIFTLGFFLMLVQMMILILQYIMSPEEVIATIQYSVLLTLFTIPLMLLGAVIVRWQTKAVCVQDELPEP